MGNEFELTEAQHGLAVKIVTEAQIINYQLRRNILR